MFRSKKKESSDANQAADGAKQAKRGKSKLLSSPSSRKLSLNRQKSKVDYKLSKSFHGVSGAGGNDGSGHDLGALTQIQSQSQGQSQLHGDLNSSMNMNTANSNAFADVSDVAYSSNNNKLLRGSAMGNNSSDFSNLQGSGKPLTNLNAENALSIETGTGNANGMTTAFGTNTSAGIGTSPTDREERRDRKSMRNMHGHSHTKSSRVLLNSKKYKRHPKAPKIKKFSISDPTNQEAVGQLVTHLVPFKPTQALVPKAQGDDEDNANANAADADAPLDEKTHDHKSDRHQHFRNECLMALRVAKFEFTQGGKSVKPSKNSNPSSSSSVQVDNDLFHPSGGFVSTVRKNNFHSINPKNKNKVRFVCITRSTNALLTNEFSVRRHVMVNGVVIGDDFEDQFHREKDGMEGESSEDDEEEGDDDDDDYSLLYNPENPMKGNDGNLNLRESVKEKTRAKKVKVDVKPEDEKSSFPSLVFIAIHSDGSHPDVRQILDLDQLVAIENVVGGGMVKLVFGDGSTVELDCEVEDGHGHHGQIVESGGVKENQKNRKGSTDPSPFLNKNRFLWSLLQIHAILCTSVMERNLRLSSSAMARVGRMEKALPQLTMRNVDRAELQYISTVNGFLSDNPILCALLDRQRNLAARSEKEGNSSGKERTGSGGYRQRMEEEKDGPRGGEVDDDMDGIAYDMIMGNFSRLTLFLSEEEKHDAEEILNSATLLELSDVNTRDSTSDTGQPTGIVQLEEVDTADKLTLLLQKRMRDLEAETCRRLIAWEDEKKYSATGNATRRRDTMEAQSLESLFETLDNLDKELEDMEEWLSDRAAVIQPLTDQCREVEEVNRELEQQQYSYELLSIELGRLLDGLDVEKEVEDILLNPMSKMVFLKNGDIDIKQSESGVDEIYQAGKALKMSFDKVHDEGGVHLRAINGRVEGLLNISNKFCHSVAQIMVSVMKRTIVEVGDNDGSDKDVKNATHAVIAKSIRTTQRQFQSSLLAYIKLIEVLALLKPSILPSLRESYSELVSEGVLSKRRLKNYFMSLPGKSSVNMDMYTIDLSIYPPVALRSSPSTDPNQTHMKPAQAKDVGIALTELLPVIAREAYFTAALFGLSAKHLSGREKKKNFESAKKSVDFSSQYFKYYIARICGIASEADAEGKKVFADPMLSLVASILLNEAMDNYIDRQKKGGDHSLSLAYVRATILDLRKKVDKQWVSWIEEQIKWIQTSPGVPLTGKRAGVFTAFSRFPSYLDHVMICCKAGRPKDHVPNLSRIKVVTYYLQKLAAALFNSLHECSERETTDQQYAANVMRMENSYFFSQTIKQRGSELTELFQKQISAASSICKQSTDAYLGFMIKREFKSLHTLFASISRIRREVGDADVPIHVPRSTFEKTLSKECNREILKEKIGSIYYRMEKHLSEAGGLLPVAWKALVKVLYEWFGRWEKLSLHCYKFSLSPSASDVVRIAKQAAGISAKKISDEKKTAKNVPGKD